MMWKSLSVSVPSKKKKPLTDDKAEELIPGEIGEISAGVPPYDSDITNKSLPSPKK